MPNNRASGVLLPVSALPGPYGIGTMGRAAYDFIDFLARAGQRYWQILPLCPLEAGNSPYMSSSSFAGNPLLLDPEALAEDGLLTKDDLESIPYGNPDHVNYNALRINRTAIYHHAWERGQKRAHYQEELFAFIEHERGWLYDYVLFMSIRGALKHALLPDWPEDIRRRTPEAVVAYSHSIVERAAYYAFMQMLFFQQWTKLRNYANQKGIAIIGDLPIYVSPYSADVWTSPELFLVDDTLRPIRAAGVPPDLFSESGQYWGNPIYNWPQHKASHYGWWRRRAMHMARLYDTVRIDHFRGLHSYWSIPQGAQTAAGGQWEKGPGMELVDILRNVPGLNLIAEDLGDLDQDARDFIEESELPGMRVLNYAFNGCSDSPYLPHNCPPRSVMYTGTHDTATFMQWLTTMATKEEYKFACDYLSLREDEGYGWGAVRGAWSSPSHLAIAPMQDILGLGADARFNVPGTCGEHNWTWRVRGEALNESVSSHLLQLTRTYMRT
ncbi:MAG: 4-alpha-glucanotransferase [Oscillospiraceae bacterium]|nr:4-alpha-glucanotransferase [Oscillospiraceae bacterium]